jgi:hypothetical protein
MQTATERGQVRDRFQGDRLRSCLEIDVRRRGTVPGVAVAEVPGQLLGGLGRARSGKARQEQRLPGRVERIVNPAHEGRDGGPTAFFQGGNSSDQRMNKRGPRNQAETQRLPGLLRLRVRREPQQRTQTVGVFALGNDVMHLEGMFADLQLDKTVVARRRNLACRGILARPLEHLEAVDKQERRIVAVDEKTIRAFFVNVEHPTVGSREAARRIGTRRVAVLRDLGDQGVADDLLALLQAFVDLGPAVETVAGPLANLQR